MKTIKYIKNTFWPNLQNSFHPYMLRTPALALAAIVVLLLQITAHIDEKNDNILGVSDGIATSRILEETNRERGETGVDPLSSDTRLQAAAQAKASHMVSNGYWGHYGPDGTGPWNFIEDSGYEYRYAGENLAKSFRTSKGVVAGWMSSPEHRDNLLSTQYEDIGIGVADGYIDGEETTVVVAMYATPGNSSLLASDGSSTTGSVVLPSVNSYSFMQPLSLFSTLPPVAQFASAAALMLGVVFVAQHVVIRRNYMLWDKHVHPRPVLGGVMLFGVVAALIQTSFGVVG